MSICKFFTNWHRLFFIEVKENHHAFIEHWQLMADLEVYMAQAHFKAVGPKFAEVLASDIEISIIEM